MITNTFTNGDQSRHSKARRARATPYFLNLLYPDTQVHQKGIVDDFFMSIKLATPLGTFLKRIQIAHRKSSF